MNQNRKEGGSKATAQTLGGREGSDTQKDPSTWVTGDEPATGAQKSYIDTLARQAGEEIDADLTKAEASEHIERLQARQDGQQQDGQQQGGKDTLGG